MKIIAGKFKGRGLKTPKGAMTRPTQSTLRGAVFNICQHQIAGARFLDLFAGSGAMGLEALSRGAAQATFVEQSRQAMACIRENIAALQVESEVELLPMPAAKALQMLLEKQRQFDLIYIDPPYGLAVDLSPVASLVAPEGVVFLEERYDPKRQATGVPGLQVKDTRRFGSTQLVILC